MLKNVWKLVAAGMLIPVFAFAGERIEGFGEDSMVTGSEAELVKRVLRGEADAIKEALDYQPPKKDDWVPAPVDMGNRKQPEKSSQTAPNFSELARAQQAQPRPASEPIPESVFANESAQVELVEITKAQKSIAEMTRDEAIGWLRTLPPRSFSHREVPLRTVLQSIADAAGMNYLNPRAGAFMEPVTLRMRANPYRVLESLCDTYGVGIAFERGIWRFYMVDHNEMLTRTYQIRYNNRASVMGGEHQLGGNLVSSGGGSGSGGGGGSGSAMGNSGGFDVDTSVLLNEVQSIIGIPMDARQVSIGYGGKSGDFTELPDYSEIHPRNGERREAQVLYINDTQSLVVTGTRDQHRLVRAYLNTMDKPQRLIKIEANFVETSRNPSSEMGLDWSDLSGTSLTFGKTFSDSTEESDSYSESTSVTIDPETGTEITLPSSNSSFSKSSSIGRSTILNIDEMTVQLHFIESDSQSRIVQDPKVVTTNQKEVTLKYVTQQPIKSAESSTTTATGTDSGSSIDYIEIGTIMSIYPEIVEKTSYADGEAVKLSLSIVVSSQTGTQVIDGNSFPVISSRTYTYSVTVPSGYTLAIGGLRSDEEFSGESSVPVLGDIPVVGSLFRKTSKDKRSSNLIAYITPTILNPAAGEITPADKEAMPSLEEMMARLESAKTEKERRGIVRRIRSVFGGKKGAQSPRTFPSGPSDNIIH
jgi:type II secretory pathway component GspD/PulD (secretin)